MKNTGAKKVTLNAPAGHYDTDYIEYNEKELGKTMISHINRDFEKGKVILVGDKQRNNKVKLDMVNITIAKTLTADGTFTLLDSAKIEPHETIYLAAHGVLRTRKIDGRSLMEIAELLVKAGYDGTQKIISFACDLDKKDNNRKTMREELRTELVLELADKKKRVVGESSINITNYANGKTILLQADKVDPNTGEEHTGEADLWIVNPGAYFQTRIALLAQKFLMYIGNFFITTQVSETGIVDMDKELDLIHEDKMKSMNLFKFGLVQYFMSDNLSDLILGPFALDVIANILQLLFTLILGLTSTYLYFTNLQPNKVVAVVIVLSFCLLPVTQLRRIVWDNFIISLIIFYIPSILCLMTIGADTKFLLMLSMIHAGTYILKWLKTMWF